MATIQAPRVPSSRAGAAERSGTSLNPLAMLPNLLLLAITLAGLPYYVLAAAARLRSPFHPWLKSSGYVGQTAGLVTFAGFLFMWLYPMRKRMRLPPRAGSVPQWLDVHIVVGLTLPLLGALHAGWRFRGLIGLGYLAMLIVCLSGVIGRYLYVRIPRSRAGAELDREEVAAQRRQLLADLTEATGLTTEDLEQMLTVQTVRASRGRLLGALAQMVVDDFARARTLRALRRRWKARGPDGATLDRTALNRGLSLARREMALSQQVRLLEATQKMFRYWHAAHKPVAIAAFGAVTVHVIVVIAVGSTWLW
jgi:hypothetical protein